MNNKKKKSDLASNNNNNNPEVMPSDEDQERQAFFSISQQIRESSNLLQNRILYIYKILSGTADKKFDCLHKCSNELEGVLTHINGKIGLTDPKTSTELIERLEDAHYIAHQFDTTTILNNKKYWVAKFGSNAWEGYLTEEVLIEYFVALYKLPRSKMNDEMKHKKAKQ